MSDPIIKQTLGEIGLSDRESDVYVYLAKTGHQTAARIAKSLRMHKAQVYYNLRRLQQKGIVETTFTTPAQFSAIPLVHILQMHVKTKEEELNQFKQHQLPSVVTAWKSMTHTTQQHRVDAFTVIEGHENTYAKVRQMIYDAQHEIIGIGNIFGMTRAQRYSVIDTANTEALRKNLSYRLIADVTVNREGVHESFIHALGPQFHVRHRDINTPLLPQFIVKDDDEALLLLWPSDEEYHDPTGLWSNNPVIVNALKLLYEELWEDAIELDKQRHLAIMNNWFETLLDHEAKKGKVKYIVFIDFDLQIVPKMIIRRDKLLERAKNENLPSPARKGWTPIVHVHHMSPGKAFLVCEADEEGIQNYYNDWSPLIEAKFVPILSDDILKDESERYKEVSDLLFNIT
jgi:sugar-specific transcriptional regulator TrmB